MKTVIVEARPSDAAGQPVDIRLAGGGRGHYLFKDQSDWRAGVISLPRIQSSLGFGKDGFTGGAVAQASAIGFSPAMASTRALVAGLVWNDAAITVSVADDEAADPSFKVRLAGTVAGYSISAGRFVFTLSDMAGRLGEPLVKDSFAGTGGIEGDAAAKGRVKRRSWGRCWNVEGRVLLAAWNIYEFGDPARPLGAFDAVKDKGRPVTIVTVAWAGSIAATLDALKSVQVPDGGCAAAPSIASVKFWTQPSTLTGDLRGELGTGYVEHVPGIAAAISAAAEGPDLDDLAALATLRPDPAGLHADDASETPAQMLDRLCLRASLSWGVTADRRLALRPIAFADPVETVAFEDVERRAAYAPIASVKVGFQKNHRVHTDAEISAAVLAGEVMFPDGQKLADLQPAQPGADKTSDNTSKDTAAVGGVPAPAIIAKFERIDPIEAKVDAQALVAEAQKKALATLTGVTNDGFEALDRAGVSRDQALLDIDRQLNAVAKSLIGQLIELDTMRGIIRDAGITVDAENGQVRFWAIENLRNDQRNLEITLDAQKGQIRSKVTVAQVEEMITLAAFDPSQIADLTSFFKRITSVEIVQDGILGTLKQKAEAIELTQQALKVSKVTNDLDALKGVVETKASSIEVEDQKVRLTDLIQRFEATPNGARMNIELRQVRAATDASKLDILKNILAGDEAEVRRVMEIAEYRQEAFVKIDDGLAAQSMATRTLSSAMGAMDARQTERLNTLVTTTGVQADRLDALQVSTDKQVAQIATLQKGAIDAAGGIAGVNTTVRQMLPIQKAGGVALLDQVVAGDEAAVKMTAQLAQAQVDMTTRFVAGELSQAKLQQLLETRIAGNAALIGQTMQAQALVNESTAGRIDAISVSFGRLSNDLGTATGDIKNLSLTTANLTRDLSGVANAQGATAKDLATLSAEMRNADTGLLATRALALRIEQASVDAAGANLKRIEAAEAVLTNPQTGLAAVNAALAKEVDLSARERAAQAQALETLTAQVIDPATKKPVWEGSIGELRRIVLDGDQKLAEDVKTVSTTVGGHTSSISFLMRSIDGDDAIAQLMIDTGAGKITGFRVNGKESLFAIAADRFVIGDSQIFEVNTVTRKIRMSDVEVNRIAAGVVDTDNLAGNAVSDTIASDFTGNSANGALNNYVTIASLTVTTTKATDRVLLMLSGVLNANVEATSGTVTNTRLNLRLQRADGTSIRAPYTALQEDNSGAYGAMTLIDLDVPGTAGTYTYQLQGSVAKSGGSGTQGATIRAVDGTFVATILKR